MAENTVVVVDAAAKKKAEMLLALKNKSCTVLAKVGQIDVGVAGCKILNVTIPEVAGKGKRPTFKIGVPDARGGAKAINMTRRGFILDNQNAADGPDPDLEAFLEELEAVGE